MTKGFHSQDRARQCRIAAPMIGKNVTTTVTKLTRLFIDSKITTPPKMANPKVCVVLEIDKSKKNSFR